MTGNPILDTIRGIGDTGGKGNIAKMMPPEIGGGGGGGGGAYGGLETVNKGSSQIGKSLGEVGNSLDQSNMALAQGRQALGGGSGSDTGNSRYGGGIDDSGYSPMPTISPPDFSGGYKKGGSVSYTGKSGRLNLGSGRVSTATKNKSNSSW